MIPSFLERKTGWHEAFGEAQDCYKKLENKIYFDQLSNLRTRAEFTRIIYQHATLKQFARNSGNDCTFPENFIIDYKEDGEFAKNLFLTEYVPGMINVIDDILGKEGNDGIVRTTKTVIGEEIVLKRLEKGKAKRDELVRLCEEKGISPYTLDNQILPKLKENLIVQVDFGWYELKDNQKQKEPETNEKDKTTGGSGASFG
jgi:hypothetical protein